MKSANTPSHQGIRAPVRETGSSKTRKKRESDSQDNKTKGENDGTNPDLQIWAE